MSKIQYLSQKHKSSVLAQKYSKTHSCPSRYLGYRDIPHIIKKYCRGRKALDFGAGTGYSTEFLRKLGFAVLGVDICAQMLEQAQLSYPQISFSHIPNRNIPSSDKTFDLIFSSFVLYELGTETEIVEYLAEAKRVMKSEGIFIALTGSEQLHYPMRKWIHFNNDFPENRDLSSGKSAKIHVYDADIEFTEFHWTESDYRCFFRQSGLELLEVHHPLGLERDPYSWKDETTYSPYIIFIAST